MNGLVIIDYWNWRLRQDTNYEELVPWSLQFICPGPNPCLSHMPNTCMHRAVSSFMFKFKQYSSATPFHIERGVVWRQERTN